MTASGLDNPPKNLRGHSPKAARWRSLLAAVGEVRDHHRQNRSHCDLGHFGRQAHLRRDTVDQTRSLQTLLHLFGSRRLALALSPILHMLSHAILLEALHHAGQAARMFVQRLHQPARDAAGLLRRNALAAAALLHPLRRHLFNRIE